MKNEKLKGLIDEKQTSGALEDVCLKFGGLIYGFCQEKVENDM